MKADEQKPTGLTEQERAIMDHLTAAWNLWARLEGKHPSDNHEFAHSLHAAQHMVAYRVARRIDPDIWSQVGSRS